MNRERLFLAASHLDTVPPEVFDMDAWAVRTSCGTVCCALGHACDVPAFKAAGLRLDWGRGHDEAYVLLDIPHTLCEGYHAAAALFGIDCSDAHYLFDPDRYEQGHDEQGNSRVTPANVAARIREFAGAEVPA